MNYLEYVANHLPKYTNPGIEAVFGPVVKDLVNKTAEMAQNANPNLGEFFSMAQAAVMNLEDIYTWVFMTLHGMPDAPLTGEDSEWEPVDIHPMIGKYLMVGPGKGVKVTSVERNIRTVAGSATEVIRCNHDNRLACMPSATTFHCFHQLGNDKPYTAFSIIGFIQEFPFQVTIPLICEIYEDHVGLGTVGDLSRRFNIVVDNITTQTYTPAGTMVYPKELPEGVEDLPMENVQTYTPAGTEDDTTQKNPADNTSEN